MLPLPSMPQPIKLLIQSHKGDNYTRLKIDILTELMNPVTANACMAWLGEYAHLSEVNPLVRCVKEVTPFEGTARSTQTAAFSTWNHLDWKLRDALELFACGAISAGETRSMLENNGEYLLAKLDVVKKALPQLQKLNYEELIEIFLPMAGIEQPLENREVLDLFCSLTNGNYNPEEKTSGNSPLLHLSQGRISVETCVQQLVQGSTYVLATKEGLLANIPQLMALKPNEIIALLAPDHKMPLPGPHGHAPIRSVKGLHPLCNKEVALILIPLLYRRFSPDATIELLLAGWRNLAPYKESQLYYYYANAMNDSKQCWSLESVMSAYLQNEDLIVAHFRPLIRAKFETSHYEKLLAAKAYPDGTLLHNVLSFYDVLPLLGMVKEKALPLLQNPDSKNRSPFAEYMKQHSRVHHEEPLPEFIARIYEHCERKFLDDIGTDARYRNS